MELVANGENFTMGAFGDVRRLGAKRNAVNQCRIARGGRGLGTGKRNEKGGGAVLCEL